MMPGMATSGDRLSFVMPMWNEEEVVSSAIEAARQAGNALLASDTIADYEVVVVDDASTDRCGAIADELAASDPRVRVIHHEHNRKLGGSIRTGFEHATGDLVLYTDIDLPFDLMETARLLRLIRTYDADILSAYRLDRRSEGLRRTIYSHLYNLLVRVVLGLRVRDVNFACKLIRRRVLDQLDLRSNGSFIDAEILARANRLGFQIIQVGLDYFPRSTGVSTLSSWGTIRKILSEMARIAPSVRRLRPRATPDAT
jgi:glycosyltransferase involved in cell wall biosynthesis